MQVKNSLLSIRKILCGIILLTIFFASPGMNGFIPVYAQTVTGGTFGQVGGRILSNGQFVYGPNVGDFNLKTYLKDNAPHLAGYADELYARSEYYSINPKVYLVLLELHGGLVTNPDANAVDNPFGLSGMGFISQIETVSNTMFDSYYLHLYSYSALPPSQRKLEPFITPDGHVVNVESSTNAGTYAIIAMLARFDTEQEIIQILDNNNPDGFYQTYKKLFADDDPLDEGNYISVPGVANGVDASQFGEPMGAGPLIPPDGLLQLPYERGLSWKFGGVHDNSGGGGAGSPLNDASSMDFYPAGFPWDSDTSNMWVVASASGTPTKISACYFKILHTDGWETTYYHLENIQNYSGSINQNDRIGVIANTLAEAICSGGSSTGPHVHFTLKKNGALVAINGASLAGWMVHAGRWNYDTDKNYMWLERNGIKKYAFSDLLLSELYSANPIVTSVAYSTADPENNNVSFVVTFSEPVTGVDISDFVLTVTGLTGVSIVNASGTGSTYTVVVNTGSGNGTIRLDVVDDDSIKDINTNPLSGVGAGNGNYTSADAYVVPKLSGANVNINGVLKGTYQIYTRFVKLITYNGFNGGPVQVTNTLSDPTISSLRLLYLNTQGKFTYSELIGVPTNQLGTDYWLPYYKNNTTDTDTQIRFTNTSTTESTTVDVYLGNNPISVYTKVLAPSSADRFNLAAGTANGPVHIVGSNPNAKILAGMRVIYGRGLSFDELMAYPTAQLGTEYWFPFYNHNNVNLDSELRIANTSSTDTATVEIYIGGVLKDTITIAPLTSYLKSFPGFSGGPVRVVSTNVTPVKLVASLRLLYKNVNGKFTFSELMGVPTSQLSNDYWLPYYKMNATDTDSQIRFTNTSSTDSTTVTVYLGNNPTPIYTKLLLPSSADRVTFPNTNGGPVHIVGSSLTAKILAGMRVIYGGGMSFDELMALPTAFLSTEYWFPFYNHNNVNLDSEIRIGVPGTP